MDHKEAATQFLLLAASGNTAEAFGKYVDPEFRHHNAFFKGDGDSLMTAMQENAEQNPEKVLEIKRVLQDGEFVVVHSHVKQDPEDLGAALVHIVRFEGPLIAELWDVGQAIPDESPNQHGAF